MASWLPPVRVRMGLLPISVTWPVKVLSGNASIVIFGLVLGTIRGLRDGSLLAPEPVATIHPVADDRAARPIA